MAKSQKSKWLATGKLVGIVAIALFILSMVIIYFEGYGNPNGLSILIIFFSFFLYLLYNSIRTWHTITKPINLIDNNMNKLSRMNELNEKYMQTRQKITDYLSRRIVNFSESTQKRFGYTFSRFEIAEGNVALTLKFPMNSSLISNSIEIRGGKFSDVALIRELRGFIDDNIP